MSLDMDKLLESKCEVQQITIAKWCEDDPTRLEMLALDIVTKEGPKIFSFTTSSPRSPDFHVPKNKIDLVKDNILNGCAGITNEQFKTWYFSRWKPEKKSAEFMSEALKMAIQCNKDLYGDGIPADAKSATSENTRIELWFKKNWPNAPVKILEHIQLVVKPTPQQIKENLK